MTILADVLCTRVRDLDEDALVEVYDRYSPELYRYACRLLGDSQLAEECVSETFSRLLLALNNGGGPRQYVRAYLYRIAHNWVTDQYRRRSVSTLPLDTQVSMGTNEEPHDVLLENLERQQVRQALARLTPEQRQVIVLRYLEDWDLGDISRSLGKPVGAVKALQHRGLNALRRLFAQAEENYHEQSI